MSSCAGNSSVNLSQPSSSNGKTPIEKLKVIVQEDGSIVGENSKGKDELGKVVGRADMWLVGHKRSDGTILESAKSKYDEVKSRVDENKRTRSSESREEDCSNTFVDIDNDELAEVFGKDKKGRVRGIGSHISKKQLIHTGVTKAMLEQSMKANAETSSLKDELSHVNTQLDGVTNLLQALYNKLANGKESSPPALTPQSELGSNSIHYPNLAQNLDNIFSTLGKDKPIDHIVNGPNVVSQPQSKSTYTKNVPVIICDKFGKDLAKGYIVTDATIGLGHGRRVCHGEKKVYVERVLDPEARL